MNRSRRPSWALCFYYAFLLLTTALSHGLPYPMFGSILSGATANVALLVDCLVLIHIILGVVRAQRLTWYLILVYNGINLASLVVTLVVLSPAEIGAMFDGIEPEPAVFYRSIALSVLAMVLATLYTVRARDRFSNSSPYLI